MAAKSLTGEEGVAALCQYLIKMSHHIACQETRIPLSIEQVHESERFYHQHLVAILIFSSSLEIQLKVHFMYEDAKAMAAKKFRKPPESITDQMAIDFFKEYCNIVAGHIQTDLKKANILVGHSLPFAVQGYNEIFFTDVHPDSYNDTFRLLGEHRSVTNSVFVHVKDQDVCIRLKGITFAAGDPARRSFELL